MRSLGLKPGLILGALRGAEAPLFHFTPRCVSRNRRRGGGIGAVENLVNR